ncbi:MAG: hypothetical protein GX471_12135 [Candidatus Microthrix parvicella]|jgi:hypothetical protein|uniref:Uncharacterized protein n=1 Tax=Candidatus Neomicrothrix parvicella RN1 TaxID=1229780 RepID=R4Z0L0_9ACTN|nr:MULTISPECIES: hypothetical protein [Microthrix]MBK7321553.1 hypothetical protein [Candidatus Microthrix sp.]NLH66904.1 hypothetical protein [Candidatus Microthrix parvicella]CCM62781.1 hypothetical protein BN381_130339 [Candidatus Microthrix parvicella RN1]HBX10677.1 hypothetical protein [Candidatus Microthrix parvicella]
MMVPPKKAMLAIGATHAHLQIQDLHQQPHQGGCPDAIASMEGIGHDALDEHAAASHSPT